MNYLFTSESVSEGHPDKVADQISDALLDEFLAYDPNSKVACETLVTTGQVVLAGEVKSNAYVDLMEVARRVIHRIGYNKSSYKFDADSCGIFSAIHEQSADINRGVERAEAMSQGAGDQGMMFGYACNETDNYMPLSLDLSHLLLTELAVIRREASAMTYLRKGKVTSYLRPDSKSQVTIEYNERNEPVRVHTIVLSTQHDEFVTPADDSKEAQEAADREMLQTIYNDVKQVLLPRVIAQLPERVRTLFDDQLILLVNPTGKFVIGGPHGDTGLTGRKIIVDTYGGKGGHGGGAFSGKDPSKVDRSAAYAARYIAKNMVAAGIADEILVELSYAIGIAEPISVFVDTHGAVCSRNPKLADMTDGEIARRIAKLFDLRPAAIVKKFGLKNPIFEATASYGHFGNRPYTRKEKVWEDGREVEREIEFFGWEKLDAVDLIKQEFGL